MRGLPWAFMCLACCAGCGGGDDDDSQPPGEDAGVDAAPVDAGRDAEPELDAAVPPECPEGLGLDVTAALEPGQVRAGRVDDAAALVTGQSADGRVGDFKIYNDQVAFIVQSERLGDNYVPWGGSVIDADLVREPGETGGDIIDEFAATPGIAAFSATCVGVVEDGSTGEAVIRAVGTDAKIPILDGIGLVLFDPVGFIVVNDYRLEPGSSTLEITTRVVNPTRRTLPLDTGDFLLLSDDEFDPFDTGPGGMSRATYRPPILGSVGEARHYALGVFADVPIDANYLGIGELIAGSGGNADVTIFIYRISSTGLEQNEEVTWTRYLSVGHDVDDIVRERQRIIPGAGDGLVTIAGVVREEGTDEPVAGARVHVVNDDSYASAALTDATGRWEARVPAGQYRVTATGTTIGQDVIVPNDPPLDPPFAAGRTKSAPADVDATAGDVSDVALILGRPVPVDLTIRDEDGNPIPGKVTFAFPDGTDPTPPDRVLGERDPYSWASNVFWTADGHVTGFVEPGAYRVTASSGFDRELDSRDVELEGGTPYLADFTLPRAIQRDGYITLDAHLHAGPSIHGEITLEERLVTNLAEGLDAMCASDHDRVVDYGPALARTGLGDRMIVLPSVEISTFLNGHFNPYPVRFRPELPDNGRVDWWDLTVDEMFTEAVDEMGAVVVQINHGGGSGQGAYFNDAGYDPVTGEIAHPDRWSDQFNVMEIQNGKGGANNQTPIYYGLLNHGKRMGITGVSDSHHRIPEAGFARTYVWLGDEEPTPEAIAFAVRDGHSVVSAGPMIFFRMDDGAGGQLREGDTLALDGAGTVHLSIRVEAPSWIPVETVTIVQEGVEIETIEVVDGAPVWLDVTRDVPVDQDTWFAVRADGTSDLAPAYSGGEPFALAGAIFVDVAGE